MKMIRKSYPAGGKVLPGKKIAASDIAALAVFFVLFGWFLYVVRFGVNAADEGFYSTIAQRVLQGDRLLVDEWQVSQFSSFLLLLPYKVYTGLTGSTEGMILFGRLLYVGVTAILYWWLYAKYRRFGFCGLAGVALFCAFVPGNMFSLFYLTMTLQGFAVLCTLLFLPEAAPRSPFGWTFTGVVLACTVLAQPPLALLYFIYCIAVLVCRLRRSEKAQVLPALQPRAWTFLTLGVAAVAVPVALYFILKSGLPEILRIFPDLFTDSEYDFGSEHIANLYWKFYILCKSFGLYHAVLWGVLLIVCGAVRFLRKREEKKQNAAAKARGRQKKAGPAKSEALARTVFLLACVCLVSSYIAGIVSFVKYKNDTDAHQLYMYYFYHAAPVTVFCAVCGLLDRKKDPAFAALLVTVLAAEVLVSYSSQVACSVCGVVLYPFALPRAVSVWQTLWAETPAAEASRRKTNKTFRAIGAAALALGLCAAVCFESIGFYVSRFCLPIEHYESGRTDLPLDTKLGRGPLKGVITNREAAGTYNAVLSDLDQIRQTGETPVYIMGTCPYLYLYLDAEIGTYSTWYVNDDAMARQLRYMQLLPEKQPAAVYIPFYDFVTYRISEPAEDGPLYDQKLAWVRQYAACTVAEGQAGYIVYISEWRLPPLR